jgi:hypothetical protein
VVEIGHGDGDAAAGAGGSSAGTGAIGDGGGGQLDPDDDTAGAPATQLGNSTVGGPIPPDGPQMEVAKVDLLIAVDNSISMADKQRLLAKAVPELLKRLVSPYCVDTAGEIALRPASPSQVCPSGSAREFEPLRDLHVGVISSSLGAHGASGARNDACQLATDDDHGHLLPLVRSDIPSYDGKGFLKWDPDGLATPPGESDVQALADSLETMITGAGENGCGYEAQLESIYRFLVDPEPPASIEVGADQRSGRVGLDQELLDERANFLRPDSSVAVLMLTDENDCSILDEGYGYLMAKGTPTYRATSACQADPNAACCQSCGEIRPNVGCPPLEQDPACLQGKMLSDAEDNPNLRCFDQKRRFGFDLLYPTARYVSGFGGGTVRNRAEELVPNPLFHQGGVDRDPSLFTLVVVGGVPWQDLAADASAGSSLEYLTAEQLQSEGRWPVILGNPAAGTPPSDVFMRESVDARSGSNPIVDVSTEPASSLDPQANPINGHEHESDPSDLQYACTFELPEFRICDEAALVRGDGCDCYEEELPSNRSVCNPPGGGEATTKQHYGKAYPTLRPLAVAKALGQRSVLGSVCAPNTQDEDAADYGYRPVFGALGRRIAATLVKP